MISKPFFSVIIPVYNVEKYLSACVESVMVQENVDLEIILVDDGSPDRCPEICDEYAQKDNRIKVIHKQNGGLSSARNAGLDIVNGEYILFLDSDDYYDDPLGLEKLAVICRESNADYVGFNCKNLNLKTGEIFEENHPIDNKVISELSGKDVPEYFSTIKYFPGAAWIAALKNSFLNNYNLRFTEGIKSEDIDWLMSVFTYAQTYIFTDLSFYVYRLFRADSITGTVNKKSILDMLFIVEKWRTELKKDCYNDNRKYLNDYLAYHYLSTLILYRCIPQADRKDVKGKICANKDMLHNLVRTKVKVAAWIYKLFGLEIGSYILMAYHRYIRHR